MSKESEANQINIKRQADLGKISPILVTSLQVDVFGKHVVVVTFYSGIPSVPDKEIVEAAVGSFALARDQAKALGEALLEFAGGGTSDE